MLVSLSHLQHRFKMSSIHMHFFVYQIGTFPPPLFTFLSSLLSSPSICSCQDACPPAVWLWVFWLSLDVDQTPVKFWTSHSPSKLAFLLFLFPFFGLFFSPLYSVLGFPFCCDCNLCTLDLLKRVIDRVKWVPMRCFSHDVFFSLAEI